MAEQLVGAVTHYFGGPSVVVVKMTDGGLEQGDRIHIVGHTTDFRETIDSMEIDHKKVDRAVAGDEIAIKVGSRARQHDQVLKIVDA